MTGAHLLPLTYDECRTRFRLAAATAGHQVHASPIAAAGPQGEELTIDAVMIGAQQPDRALVVLSGVHGVEGFITSQMQTDLISRLDPVALPDDAAVLLVHAVNPWGMAWGRRQNESNVDLNRNWRRSETEPLHNDAYDIVHPLACPDTDRLPDVDALLVEVRDLVATHGVDWLTRAITTGQFRHPDGLHYGGERTEESNRTVEWIVSTHLGPVARSLVLDLHTGDGPTAVTTFLSDHPSGTWQDDLVQRVAGGDTIRRADRGHTRKPGSIASGIGQLLPGAAHVAATVEWGTVSDMRQLVATYLESWVHRHGDRSHPDHAAVILAYRSCFTPEDDSWTTTCLAAGATVLDRAVATVVGWADDRS